MKQTIIFIMVISAGLWILPKDHLSSDSKLQKGRIPSSDNLNDEKTEKAVAYVTIKSASIKTKGNDEQAQLNTRIEMKIIGKTMEKVAAQMMNIDIFNSIAEISRVTEGDHGHQKTVRTAITTNSYSLLKKAWVVHKIFGTIDVGETQAICKFYQAPKLFTLECKNDANHKMTNKRMLSLYSYLRCDELSTEISCTQTLSLTPKKMTIWGKSITANEVAQIGGLQSIRLNSAIAFSLVTKSPAEAYAKFNSTNLEIGLTKFKTDFHEGVEEHNFKFPDQ